MILIRNLPSWSGPNGQWSCFDIKHTNIPSIILFVHSYSLYIFNLVFRNVLPFSIQPNIPFQF